MPDGEVQCRYHELVDLRMLRPLTTLESFELERIETRLDSHDADLELRSRNQQLDMKRDRLLDSISMLLTRLRD